MPTPWATFREADFTRWSSHWIALFVRCSKKSSAKSPPRLSAMESSEDIAAASMLYRLLKNSIEAAPGLDIYASGRRIAFDGSGCANGERRRAGTWNDEQ